MSEVIYITTGPCREDTQASCRTEQACSCLSSPFAATSAAGLGRATSHRNTCSRNLMAATGLKISGNLVMVWLTRALLMDLCIPVEAQSCCSTAPVIWTSLYVPGLSSKHPASLLYSDPGIGSGRAGFPVHQG